MKHMTNAEIMAFERKVAARRLEEQAEKEKPKKPAKTKARNSNA